MFRSRNKLTFNYRLDVQDSLLLKENDLAICRHLWTLVAVTTPLTIRYRRLLLWKQSGWNVKRTLISIYISNTLSSA
jgi:hypothetical protein